MSGQGGWAITGQSSNQPQIIQDIQQQGLQGGQQPTVPQKNGEGHFEVDAPDVALQEKQNLVKQLDVLLARATKNATKLMAADEIKGATEQLPLSKSEKKTIDAAVAKAQEKLEAINDFTGRQLGETVIKKPKYNNTYDWNSTKAGKALKSATEALSKLSELLHDTLNKLPPSEARNSLEEAKFQCDRRLCEIETLVCEFAILLEDNEPENPAVKARLDSSLSTLMPSKALEMHGNFEAIAAMRESVEPLAKRLDDLTKQAGTTFSSEELAVIDNEINLMANALENAIKSGEVGGRGVDRTLFAAAKTLLGEVREKLKDAYKEFFAASMQNFVEKAFRQLPFPFLDPNYNLPLAAIAPQIGQAVAALEHLRRGANEFVKNPTKEKWEQLDELARIYANLSTKDFEKELKTICGMLENARSFNQLAYMILNRAEKNLKKHERDLLMPALNNSFAALLFKYGVEHGIVDKNNHIVLPGVLESLKGKKGLPSQTAHLRDMWQAMTARKNHEKFVTGAAVRAVFEGELRFTTLVESRIHGMEDADVDPELDDIHVRSSHPLGSGRVNTVYEVSYDNDTTYVFKPEAAGRMGFQSLNLAHGTSNSTMVAQLNMAAQKTADALGLGDVMAKTTVGSHKGEFGIFMEKVPGVEISVFGSEQPKPEDYKEGELTAAQVRALPDDKYAKVIGSLMRKANRLDWFDLITGQGDRHPHNYMVSVMENGTTSLKGIDNDAGFPPYRIGMRTFHLTGKYATEFETMLDDVKVKFYPKEVQAMQFQRIEKDPGVTRNLNGSYTVDTTKIQAPELLWALQKVVGLHTAALPDHIDEELYNKLVELEKGPARDQYVLELKARLPQDAVDAAVKRLDEAIAHAKTLKADGRVITADDWNSQEVQRKLAGKLPAAGKAISLPEVGGQKMNKANAKEVAYKLNRLKASYFQRDLLTVVAKPGWFEAEGAA